MKSDSLVVYQDSLLKVMEIHKIQEPAAQESFNFWLGLVIALLSGLLSGTLVYLLRRLEQRKNARDGSTVEPNVPSFWMDEFFITQVVLGVIGALLAPLFLYLIDSQLFLGLKGGHNEYFVFAGYCIIGGVFARSLLNSIAKRLNLSEIQAELIAVKRAQEEDKVYERELEENSEEDAIADSTRVLTFQPTQENLSDKQKVFKEMKNPKYKDRSIKGLARRTKLDLNIVEAQIQELIRLGLVRSVVWYGRQAYRLTHEGIEKKVQDIM